MGGCLGWKGAWRLLRVGHKSYRCNGLHVMLMCTVFTARILHEAWGASVPLYILAWAWGALSRHRIVGLYKKSESLDTSWRWPCGGPLQVVFKNQTKVIPAGKGPTVWSLSSFLFSKNVHPNSHLHKTAVVTWLLLTWGWWNKSGGLDHFWTP